MFSVFMCRFLSFNQSNTFKDVSTEVYGVWAYRWTQEYQESNNATIFFHVTALLGLKEKINNAIYV